MRRQPLPLPTKIDRFQTQRTVVETVHVGLGTLMPVRYGKLEAPGSLLLEVV